MLSRPSRLRYAVPDSALVIQSNYLRGKPIKYFTFFLIFSLVPYASVRTYNRIERLGFWESRIEKKRVRKMAFDFMLKSQAEKERDLIEEFADF